MADGTAHDGPAGERAASTVDLRWAGRQRLLAAVGTLISLLAVVVAGAGLSRLPLSAADARPYAIIAAVGAATLALACIVILICWLIQLPAWASGLKTQAGSDSYHRRALLSLVAHLLSYAAVLVTMYGALAASALAYWDSAAGSLLGVTFILAIFGQILGGTQLLRRSGPPATIPSYLRRLDDKVQSLR